MPESIDRINAALSDRYRVERLLGEGGMATVYLAEDLKHRRKVALKILKPDVAAVVGSARFLAEIETTANLHHPHILPLHDSGEADGLLYYAMPRVEGESLRDRLDREGQLPVEEAVRIAVAVAGALEHAHARGVIHRDIKPGNILLQDGQPLVADFGIALAVGTAAGNRLTETGIRVGTPFYMSPEQATGDHAVGPASDVYALACVLYEMLVGEPPFAGTVAQAMLGRIISGSFRRPRDVRPLVPANVDAALRKALERLPADRFSSARAFARALGDRGFRYGPDEDARAAAQDGRRRRATVGAVAVAALVAAMAGWVILKSGAPRPVARYSLRLPDGHDIGQIHGSNLAVSPDGSRLVYVGPGPGVSGRSQLWLKRRDELDPTPLPGTEDGHGPSFSPDGSRIAFLVGRPLGAGPFRIKVSSLTGDPPVIVAEKGVGGDAVWWGGDGKLYYEGVAPTGGPWGILRVPASGGAPEQVTSIDAERQETFHEWPELLPGGNRMLFTATHTSPADVSEYNVAVADLAAGTHRVLVRGVFGRYAPSGHLLYVTSSGALMGAPFDPDAMQLTGPPVRLARGVTVGLFGSVDLSLADDGTLVYRTGGGANGIGRVVWVGRDGGITPVDSAWSYMPFPTPALSLSPDGKSLALFMQTEAGEDIWVKMLGGGAPSRLTFDTAEDRDPRWAPDGKHIYFISNRNGHDDVWSRAADGSGEAEMVLDLPTDIEEFEAAPGQHRFLVGVDHGDSRDLVAVTGGDTLETPVAGSLDDEVALDLSDNGRWVAYESITRTGETEVYVSPFGDASRGRWQVSTDGGSSPRWGHDGRELFYVDASGMMVSAQVETAPGFRVVRHTPLFSVTDRHLLSGNYAEWDVAPGGQRFIMIQLTGENPDQRHDLVVVENFFRELKEKVGS